MPLLERLDAWITQQEKELFRQAADAKGLTLAAFVMSSAREAALKTLKKRHRIAFGRKNQQALVTKPRNHQTK